MPYLYYVYPSMYYMVRNSCAAVAKNHRHYHFWSQFHPRSNWKYNEPVFVSFVCCSYFCIYVQLYHTLSFSLDLSISRCVCVCIVYVYVLFSIHYIGGNELNNGWSSPNEYQQIFIEAFFHSFSSRKLFRFGCANVSLSRQLVHLSI